MIEKTDILREWLGVGSINIFGLPFAGKDTVCNTLAGMFNGRVLGGGDILRNNPIPQNIKSIIDTGTLAPSDDFLNIVLPHFSDPSLEGHPLILSSIGRWHGEERGVIEAAEKSGHPLRAVILVDVGEAEIRRRWQVAHDMHDRGVRADDAQLAIGKRMEEYRLKTVPVLNYYEDEHLLIKVNGNPDPQTVIANVVDALEDFSKGIV